MSENLLHRTHPEIIKRLRRAEGHPRSTIAMIETGRPCIELAQQLHAVEKAIAEAKRALIHDHVDHCLEAAVGQAGRGQRATVEEFKANRTLSLATAEAPPRCFALHCPGWVSPRIIRIAPRIALTLTITLMGIAMATPMAWSIPRSRTTARGIWAIRWSFAIVALTAAAQLVVVALSGSVALLADCA
jgi:uncharacterized protein